tara:strand:- start:62 stop:2035 length:1974 start_codon:yes stop_codon:yes gene_type:complete
MSNTKTVMSQAANTQGLPLDITDVFSTYLYAGTGGTQTITNGIDLEGEGGLVWIKTRDYTYDHALYDTERGANNHLESNTYTAAVQYGTGGVNAFNSNGFSLDGGNDVNNAARKYTSWTFRKAEKFFDIVTWTGNSTSGREIAHNLGSVPGMIIVKSSTEARQWMVYHRSTGKIETTILNSTVASANTALWNSTDPTSTVFTLNNDGDVNTTGNTYVAYLFAHNNGDGEFGPDGDQDIIKCGSYVGAGSGNNIEIGFEPQWLLIKNITQTAGWVLFDNMRGIVSSRVSGGADARLYANATTSENTGVDYLELTPTGIDLRSSNGDTNAVGQSYIYMAIRRGPLAPPEAGTEVFAATTLSATGPFSVGFPTDTVITRLRTATNSNWNSGFGDRLRGNRLLVSSSTAAEGSDGGGFDFTLQDSFKNGISGSSMVFYNLRRAPSFFDVITWQVDGTVNQTINHNLGVIPEMIIHKNRNDAGNGSGDWNVAHKDLPGWDSSNENDRHLLKLSTSAASQQQGYHRDFTDTSIRLISNGAGGGNTSHNCIGYLFATLAGVSKVGGFTGNGTSQTIDCGFTTGARFVIIKSATDIGNWLTFDTERGIVAGDDPHLNLNETAAEVTINDSIDPHSSGFIVNLDSAAFVYDKINISAKEYIFYAIA